MAKAKKQPSGNWRVQVYDYTDAKGKRHYKSFTADTKKEAEYQAAEYLLTSTRGAAPTYDNLTLGEAVDRYIESKSAILSPSTVRGYKKIKRCNLSPILNVRLAKINQELIQVFVNEITVKYSPKTVRNIHGLISPVLKAYAPSIHIHTAMPRKSNKEPYIPTAAEVRALIDAATDVSRVPLMLAAYGGLRREEICALTADDFTPFGVNITKAAVYDENFNIVIKPPKTVAGTRFVSLPPELIVEVKKYNFTGEVIPPSTVSSWFAAAHKRARLPKFSLHKLRHFFASELHAQGIPDLYIIKALGWESTEMLHKIYGHTLRDKDEEMCKKITDISAALFSKTKEMQA